MALHAIRILFVLTVVAVTFSFAFQPVVLQTVGNAIAWVLAVPAAMAVVLVLGDILWQPKRLATLSGLFFGLIAGLIIAWVLSFMVDSVEKTFFPAELVEKPKLPPQADREESKLYNARLAQWQTYTTQRRIVQLAKLLLGAGAVYICVTFVLQTKDVFRFVIPYVEFARENKGPRPLLLDTSAIIDGRIADIVETEALESEIIVPRFVLAELQSIADASDKLKRNRGRRGLDVLDRLQASDKADVRITDIRAPEVDAAADVDAKLVALARHLGGRVVTNDYNLNKVARLRDVRVVNVNDLANALKPVFLPGESVSVKLVKPGEEAGQGVGYLEDGTMVVVEQGRDFIGRQIAITVTSVLQTSAGRMVFGRMDADKSFSRRRT